jgi:hypothetical protein
MAGRALATTVLLALAACASRPFRLRPGEAGAITDVRTVVSAQAAYSTVNHGLFDEPQCLERPWTCLDGYPEAGPAFLCGGGDCPLSRADAYVRTFHPGPRVPDPERPPAASRSSIRSYAFTAVPRSAGRLRAFCGDSEGRICEARPGAPAVLNARCSDPCLDLDAAGER